MFLRPRTFCLFLLLAFFPVIVFAQEDESGDWFWDKEIAEVTFENIVNVKRSELNGITSNYIGKKFNETIYAELTDRLYSLDVFEEIEPYAKPYARDKNKITLVFSVKERPVVHNINFTGNKKIRNGELRDTIKLKSSDVFVESRMLIDERAIRDLYLTKGFTMARVTSSVENTPKGIDITFEIEEGASTIIKSIVFQGNTVVSSRTLKRKISLKEKGFLRDGSFQRASLETDRQTVEAYYHERGYADAQVLDVLQETAMNEAGDVNEMTLTFVVQEGIQYTISTVDVSGNTIFSRDRLVSLLRIKEGSVYNLTKIQEGMQRVIELYMENGYMTNQYVPDISRDTEGRTISYLLTIQERSRSHVENIIINGNTKTKDYVILREIGLESGDVFSREKLMTGLRNLYNLRYFSSIVPEPVQGSEENLVDLVVSVEEQSTMSLNFGLTFSGITDPSDFPISVFAQWENSNVRGEGRTLGANLSLSTMNQSIGFSYGQNWTGGLPISLNESVTLEHSIEHAVTNNFDASGGWDNEAYYLKYQRWGANIATSAGRRWLPSFAIFTLTGGLTVAINSNVYDTSLYVPVDTSLSRDANGVHVANSLWIQASLDDRDVNYDPSKGWFASQRFTWRGILPGVESEFFLRSDTKLEGYFTLFNVPVSEKWSFKMVAAAYLGYSAIIPTPNSLFSHSSKLYINGMFDGRGWTDIYNKNRGRGLLSAKFELRMPIVPGIIGITGFFDIAAVKQEPREIFTNLPVDEVYFSLGPGIRFLLPQFPLHLLLANTFQVKDGSVRWDSLWNFVLSFNVVNR